MIRESKAFQKPFIIPIFVPHRGCPHHCVFCNQTSITGAGPNINMSSITKRINEVCGKVALRRSKDLLDHSKARFTANERVGRYFVSKLALRAQTLDLRPFRFTKSGYRKNPDSRSELLSPVFQRSLNDQLMTRQGTAFRREVAFYGGSFTGIEKKVQRHLLSAVQPLIRKGLIDSVRVSTRPDYIDPHALGLLKEYGVMTVELGVQSMVEEVLQCSKRGHTVHDVLKAVELLHDYGFEVGIQIMVGLPGDDTQGNVHTVDGVIQLNPHFVRIYPTLVLKGTLLEKWYRSGLYTPLSLEEAVELCKRAFLKFYRAGIPVIRLGLQSSPQLEAKDCVVAGPYHPAFRHLVESCLFFDMASCMLRKRPESRILRARVSPSDLSNIRGQKNENLYKLKESFGLSDIQIEVDEDLPRGSLIAIDGEEMDAISYRTLPFS